MITRVHAVNDNDTDAFIRQLRSVDEYRRMEVETRFAVNYMFGELIAATQVHGGVDDKQV